MSNNQETDHVLELIDIVDGAEGLFGYFDSILGDNLFPTIMVICLFGAVFIYLILFANLDTLIVVALALLAFIVSFFTLFITFQDRNIVNVNYNRINHMPNEGDQPLLKALIIIKEKNPDFTLKQLYSLHPDLFKRERLIEKLIE